MSQEELMGNPCSFGVSAEDGGEELEGLSHIHSLEYLFLGQTWAICCHRVLEFISELNFSSVFKIIFILVAHEKNLPWNLCLLFKTF